MTQKIFISYSWDSEEHKTWVLSLAQRLIGDGVDITLDQFDMRLGTNLTHYMENSMKESDRVIIIMTENYKLKADGRKGGVGYEYSIINSEIYKNQLEHKFIPILCSGTFEKSTPTFLKSYIVLDMTSKEKFEKAYNQLIRDLYNEPIIEKPILGTKPKFKKKDDSKWLSKNVTEVSNNPQPFLKLAAIEEKEGNIGDYNLQYSARWWLKKAAEVSNDDSSNSNFTEKK